MYLSRPRCLRGLSGAITILGLQPDSRQLVIQSRTSGCGASGSNVANTRIWEKRKKSGGFYAAALACLQFLDNVVSLALNLRILPKEKEQSDSATDCRNHRQGDYGTNSDNRCYYHTLNSRLTTNEW